MHMPPKSSVARCTLELAVNTYWKVTPGPYFNWLLPFQMRFLRAIHFQNFPTESIYLYCHHLKGRPGAGL